MPSDDRYRHKHSLSGVLSCAMAVSGLLLWMLGLWAHRHGGGLGLVVLVVAWSAMFSFCLIGLGLAIHGVIPRRRKKIFPFLGLMANPLIIIMFVIYFWWPTPDTLVAAAMHNDRDGVDHALLYGVKLSAHATLNNDEVKAGATALTAAVQMGRLDMAEYLLERGADINASDVTGATPLYHAVTGSHTKLVDFLLQHKADPDIAGPTGFPIQVAARQGHQAILELLIKYDADVNLKGHSPLYEAATLGHNGITRLLIDAKADLNAPNEQGRTPVHAAARQGHVHVLRQLLARGAKVDVVDDQGVSPLDLAIEADHDELAKVLIEKGSPIDIFTAIGMADHERVKQIIVLNPQAVYMVRKGRTPLHEAVRLGQLETAQLLLKHKADIRILTADTQNITPLQLAVIGGSVEMVKLLIDAGADVNRIARNEEIIAPPLYYAVIKGNVAVARLLLEQGADVNALCETSETAARPMFFAVAANEPEIIKLLLGFNAQIDGRKSGAAPTPLYEAVRLGYLDVVMLLMRQGANPNAKVGDSTPIALAEARRNRDPLVYDRILNLLQGNTSIPTPIQAPQAAPK